MSRNIELLSHIKTESQDLADIYSWVSVPNTRASSWFSTKSSYLPSNKWLKTFWQSDTVYDQDCTHSENINLKSPKIRIYPEPKLHLIWKKLLAATKYCCNQSIADLRKNGKVSKYDSRKIIVKNAPNRVQKCPYNPFTCSSLRRSRSLCSQLKKWH